MAAVATDYPNTSDLLPHQRDRTTSMSLGRTAGPENGESPANGAGAGAGAAAGQPAASKNDAPKEVREVLNSEIGVSTMLNRLKQSIASARVSSSAGLLRTMAGLRTRSFFSRC